MVTNPEFFPKDILYECNLLVGKYLVRKCGIPPFNITDKKYIFIKTKVLLSVVTEMPFPLKLISTIYY